MGIVSIWATANSEWFNEPPKSVGDGMCYDSIAHSLCSGLGFRENYTSTSWRSIYQDSKYKSFLAEVSGRDVPATGRPPLYPLLVAFAYSIFGRYSLGFIVVRLGSALCIAAAVGLAVGVCAKILYHFRKGKLVVALGSCSVLLLAASQRTLRDYATDFLTEPLALFLTQILITLLVVDLLRENSTIQHNSTGQGKLHRASIRSGLIAGAVYGLMILTRSLFIAWLPGLLLLIYFGSQLERRFRIWRLSAFAASALMVCSPWWIHNCLSLNRFMPLGTQGPIALAGGYCDQAYEDGGNWSFVPEQRIRAQIALEMVDPNVDQTRIELAVVERCKAEVRKWIEQNTNKLPTIAIQRAVSHWNPYTGKALLWKLAILSGVIWALFFGGKLKWYLVGLPVLSTVVTMALYETGGRFLVPLYGLLFTLSGLGLTGWLSSKQKD